jgi:hypothetical protein
MEEESYKLPEMPRYRVDEGRRDYSSVKYSGRDDFGFYRR